MIARFVKCAAAILVTAALVGLSGVAVELAAQPKQIPPFDGVWKLNVEASVNPNGPPQPARRGGGGRGGGRSSAGVTGGVLLAVAVPAQGSSASPDMSNETISSSLAGDEQVRFDAMKNFIYAAPQMMGVSATATEFKLVLDPVKKLGFTHKLDNKAEAMTTAGGPGQFKARWDGVKIRRELETKDSLKMNEEYSLSPDTKQLIVIIKASSSMVRMDNREVKRVYDRVATP